MFKSVGVAGMLLAMKRDWVILCSAAFLIVSAAQSFAAPVIEGMPPRELTDPRSVVSRPLAGAAPVPLADLFFTRGGSDAIWVPSSDAVVIATNLSGRYNLWTMPAKGGFPLQLTQSDDRQLALTASPDGKWVVFQSDQGGAEIYDLYATPASGGAVIDLTNTPDVDEQSATFSPDGSLLAFTRRPKSEPSDNIAVMDFATRRVRQLTHEAAKDHAWAVAAFSHDGKSILVDRTNATGSEAEAWLIDIASGSQTRLTPPQKYNWATDISSDGRYVALTTETVSGNRQAALLDLRDKSVRILKPDVWRQKSDYFSPDGRTLVFKSSVDGRTVLAKYDVGSGKSEPLSLPDGFNDEASDQNGFSPDGSRILVAHQASNTPFDFWVVEAKTGAATQLTRLGLASIDPARLPKAEIVHYKSYDGTVISAFLWMPFNLARDGKAPGVVLPHGGPTSQTVERFDRTAAALASRGFVVIAPNVRGSTGYGRAFQEANYKDLGGGDLKDEVAGRQFLVDTGYVDETRIGMTGGSYGGFMTLMALAKTPSLWAAGVDEYGIIDWQAMLLHEDKPDQQYEEGFLGDPVKDKDVYTASSPLTYMKNTTAPLLVLQGDNDARVTKDQAEKVVEVLKANGRTVEAHFYPAEGHGFFKREDQIDALERTVAWLEKYLKK
ncbi:MAG TPA: S9 family peptidase [Thermoanaerobaculia bacterium]|nr:S9 family peptidase [Thermoanaerobaculia bacterium]